MLLYDIEVRHIDDKNILLKFVLEKMMPGYRLAKILQEFGKSEFFCKLEEQYNVGTCVCYREGVKVTQEMADAILEAVEELILDHNDQQGIINNYPTLQCANEISDLEHAQNKIRDSFRVSKRLVWGKKHPRNLSCKYGI